MQYIEIERSNMFLHLSELNLEVENEDPYYDMPYQKTI